MIVEFHCTYTRVTRALHDDWHRSRWSRIDAGAGLAHCRAECVGSLRHGTRGPAVSLPSFRLSGIELSGPASRCPDSGVKGYMVPRSQIDPTWSIQSLLMRVPSVDRKEGKTGGKSRDQRNHVSPILSLWNLYVESVVIVPPGFPLRPVHVFAWFWWVGGGRLCTYGGLWRWVDVVDFYKEPAC